MTAILGVDLTMSGGLGLCALPLDWDLDWSRLAVERAASSWAGGLDYFRLVELARHAVRFAVEHQCRHAFLEGYLTARAFRATNLAEVGGAIRMALCSELGLATRLVPLSSARKLLFGSVPKGAKKGDYHERLAAMGAPTSRWSHDEADAFVIANWGAAELGACALATPPPPKKKTKKP